MYVIGCFFFKKGNIVQGQQKFKTMFMPICISSLFVWISINMFKLQIITPKSQREKCSYR